MTLCCCSLVDYSCPLSVSAHSFMLMTVSRPRLHLVFSLPSFGLPHPPRMVYSSVNTLTFSVPMRGQNDRLPLIPIFPLLSVDLYLPPFFRRYILSVSPFSFFLHRVVLSLSQLHGTVATSRLLAHTAVKYYIFNRQQCYPPTNCSKPDSLW